MYYSTSNHYFDDSPISQTCETMIENNDCLICLEIYDKSGQSCIKLHNLVYIKSCLCDGWIHCICLEFWYDKNKKCPICLCNMCKNEIKQQSLLNINTTTALTESIVNVYHLFHMIKLFSAICFFYSFIFLLSKIIETIFIRKQ